MANIGKIVFSYANSPTASFLCDRFKFKDSAQGNILGILGALPGQSRPEVGGKLGDSCRKVLGCVFGD